MSVWSLTCLECWREWIVARDASWSTPCKCRGVVRVKARDMDGAKEEKR